jgi:hypothetical protein
MGVLFNLEIGECLKHKDPYEGEGEIMYAGQEKDLGLMKFIVACNTKYPVLNGQIVLLQESIISKYYNKVR